MRQIIVVSKTLYFRLFSCLGNKAGASNILDSDETPIYSASHPDSRCLHMKSRSALRRLRIKITWEIQEFVSLDHQEFGQNISKGR